MSLGKTAIIRPDDEGFYSNGAYILIHPDDMKPGAALIQECATCQPLVMFIGGAKDDEYKNVLQFIFHPYNVKHESHQDIGYGTFQTASAITNIAREWHGKGQKICLVGHSYGADTAMVVAQVLSAEHIDIELVVTLDPVGRKFDDPPAKPDKLHRWLNVYVDYKKEECKNCGAFTPNGIAKLGGPWQSCAGADKNMVYVNYQYPCWSHAEAAEMFKQFGYDIEVANVK